MRAEIIAVGTELLLGEIVDTNTTTIARTLRELGLDLFRSTTVGDNAARICAAIQESLSRADIIITSGGLGPTVDDATREGIARAFSRKLEFRTELWEQIKAAFDRFGALPTENNRRQAHVPNGSIAVENPVGTAPAFIVEGDAGTLIALPGVPNELEFLLENKVIPYLREQFGLGAVIHTRIVRTAGVGESWLDDQIQDLEVLENPTVGLAAHPGRVDIRITAKAADRVQAQDMITEIETDLLEWLGEVIYGYDDDTLEGVVSDKISERGWRLCLVEIGTGSRVGQGLAAVGGPFAGAVLLPSHATVGELREEMARSLATYDAQMVLGVHLSQEGERQRLIVLLQAPEIDDRAEYTYGGALPNGPSWAASLALNLIRESI